MNPVPVGNGARFSDASVRSFEKPEKIKMGTGIAQGTPNRKKISNGSGTPGNGKKIRISPAGRDYAVGTRVEAKDFSGQWYPAKVSEVDYEEREILIHFDSMSNDEWMPMDSQRIRPLKEPDAPSLFPANLSLGRITGMKGRFFPEPKPVERRFKIGEDVMATWTNNCKYPATVLSTQPNDRYDVIFYDGYRKSVRGSKISKMKEADVAAAKQRMLQLEQRQIQFQQQKQLQLQQQHSQPQMLHGPKSSLQNVHYNGSNGLQSKTSQNGQTQLEQRLLQPHGQQIQSLTGMPYQQTAPPIVDGLLPIDENIGTKEQRRERKRKLNVKELFSTKRPRGSAKYSRAEKKQALSDAALLGASEVSGSSLASTSMGHSMVPSQGNKLLLGVDPMFPANPMKVEGGYLPTASQDLVDDNISTGINGEVKKKRKRLKKKKEEFEAEESEPGSKLKPSKVPSPSSDDDECSIQWTNGEPQGEAAYVIESAEGPRKSIIVDDRRLPEGWSKHAIRRQGGTSAGKWDVFLVSPKDGRKFRSRNELRSYHIERGLKFQVERFDFSLGRKRMYRQKVAAAARAAQQEDRSDTSGASPSGAEVHLSQPVPQSHASASVTLNVSQPSSSYPPTPHSLTPQVTPQGVQRVKTLLPRVRASTGSSPSRRVMSPPPPHAISSQHIMPTPPTAEMLLNKKSLSAGGDGFSCPKDGCGKRFRKENLLQMHIKHYHPEYNAFMGSTPNVADLAYARTVGEPVAEMPHRNRPGQHSSFMEKIEKISLMEAHRKAGTDGAVASGNESTSSLEAKSPTLGLLLKKGPMRKDSVDGTTAAAQAAAAWMVETASDPNAGMSLLQDAFCDKSVHSSPLGAGTGAEIKQEILSRPASRTAGMNSEFGSDHEAFVDQSQWKPGRPGGLYPPSTSCSPVTVQPSSYFYSKKKNSVQLEKFGGDAIKHEEGKPASPPTEHLRREELINCTCGITEEDGLMIQCDLCLCWQHGLCNKIENQQEVPDKYVCQICLNPLRERRSRHYIHDQDWLKEGTLPSATYTRKNLEKQRRREEILKRSHDLCALLLETQKVIHSLRVKVHIAEQKDHPKLYLWANSWLKESVGCPTPPSSPAQGTSDTTVPKFEPEPIGVGKGKSKSLLQEALLNGRPQHQHQLNLLPPPPPLPTPLDQFSLINKKHVDAPRIPQPEAPIDPRECRLKLLDHIEHFQSLIDSRLTALEGMIDVLEREDPILLDEKPSDSPVKSQRARKALDSDDADTADEDKEDFFPQTKETVQMVLRDLLNMRKLATLID